MRVLERGNTQRIFISTGTGVALAAGLVFIGLMVWHSAHLSGALTAVRSERVSFGPLALAELTKAPALANTYRVSIQLLSGLWLYAASTIALGLGVALLRISLWKRNI